jgi:uncharacterized protein
MNKQPGPVGSTQGAGYFAPLSASKYMLLTTYRRAGTPVGTPVHVVGNGDVAFFRTWDTSGKAKRLRHTSLVEVTPSNLWGRPRGPTLRAKASLLGPVESEMASRLLAQKHPVLHGHLIPWYHRRRGWVTQHYRLDPA